MISAGILGATGYAGSELARILCRHPDVQITSVASIEGVGKKLGEFFPHLWPLDVTIQEELTGEVDVIFAGLPHAVAASLLLPYIDQNVPVIDFSADFRLKDASVYEQWYKTKHPRPELLKEAVYGLPELYRDQVRGARLIANPGCYPTSAILALAPAVKNGLVDDIVIDSKSGTSGAGRSATLTTLLAEAGEGVSAYALGGHRHLPEIAQELQALAPGGDMKVTFVPHLMPMVRGILTTCYAPLRKGISEAELRGLCRDFYRDEPFVRVVDAPPQTKHTRGTNLCIVHPTVDTRTNRLIVVSSLDNLVKGAAGQAVQNMNLMFGLPETAGLEQLGLYP